MATSTYSLEDERQINFHLKKILEVLSVQIPDDHFGMVEIAFPRQNGKIAGEVEVKLRSRYKREGRPSEGKLFCHREKYESTENDLEMPERRVQ